MFHIHFQTRSRQLRGCQMSPRWRVPAVRRRLGKGCVVVVVVVIIIIIIITRSSSSVIRREHVRERASRLPLRRRRRRRRRAEGDGTGDAHRPPLSLDDDVCASRERVVAHDANRLFLVVISRALLLLLSLSVCVCVCVCVCVPCFSMCSAARRRRRAQTKTIPGGLSFFISDRL